MKLRRHNPNWLQLTAVIAAAACLAARGQSTARRVIEEPQWLKMRPPEATVGIYGEGRFEETKVGGSTVTHDRLFLGPLFGVNTDGSIYHPNLFRFVVNGEIATGVANDRLKTSERTVSRSEFEYLGRLSGSGRLFPNRPYNATIFGDIDHGYRDYDFFNRVTVDSSRYGAKVAYDDAPIPMSATFTRYEEETSGSLRGLGLRTDSDTRTFQDVFNYNARHDRERGNSIFNYTWDRYSRTDFGRASEGINHTATLSDNERFGENDKYRLFSNVTYSRRDDVETSDEILGAMNLAAQHRRTLSSYYDFTYDRFETGEFDSSSYVGRAELRHQLYESLTSALIFQGAHFEASDGRTDGYTDRYGIGLAEAYTKRLGARHRMRLSNTVFVEHVDQQSIGTVQNERHVFGELGAPPGEFFLNLPDVTPGTIVVTDQNDSRPAYVLGLDYGIQRNGSRTIVTRLTGSRIGATDVVLVDYEATPGTSGEYDNLTDTALLRFDLFENLWGLYARANLTLNNADRDMRVPDIVTYAFGTDLSWRWFRAGAEYEVFDSDLSRYNSARLFQSAAYNIDQDTTISLDLAQSWTDYQDADRQEADYRFITRFHQNVTSSLRFDLEGGVDLRRGEGVDQTLATVRPGVNWYIGKTSLKAGYDYEYSLFLEREERTRHLFFIRIKRVF